MIVWLVDLLLFVALCILIGVVYLALGGGFVAFLLVLMVISAAVRVIDRLRAGGV